MGQGQALVLVAPRQLELRTFDLPDVGPDDAVLRVEACGLCGTDHEQFTGALPIREPVIPGHETVGVIENIGASAAELWGVSQGDRVAVEVFRSCRECDACRSGNTQRCAIHGLGTAYGFAPLRAEPGLWGGYATHQYLGPGTVLHRVPDDLDPVTATLFNPLGAGVRWARTVPGTTDGDIVAILGPGIRGLSSLVAVKEAGAGFVMVTGAGDHDEPRLEVARSFGADLVVNVAEVDPVTALREAAGALADVVVDVTAKAPAALAQGVNLAREGGTLVLAGTRGSGDTPGFWPDLIVYKELQIVGALGVDSVSYAEALRLLGDRNHPWADIPRRVVGFDQTATLLSVMAGESQEFERPTHGVVTSVA